MFITEEDKGLVEYLETEFGKHGIFQHGLPLGIGLVDITTNSKDLNAFIWSIQTSMAAASMGRKTETDDEIRAFVLELQGLPKEKEDSDWEFHRSWVSAIKWKGSFQQICIWRHKQNGTYRSEISPLSYTKAKAQMLITTCLIRSRCTFVETENVARERLLQELDEVQKKQYLLTDSFMETGRSGVIYVLRRNRPTLAMRLVPGDSEGLVEADLLCALCMHPLAYYDRSWAGVMPPSDEILAHLLHIRSDEHRYWKVCNQHPPSHYLSGL
jgi:hypothetical protein